MCPGTPEDFVLFVLERFSWIKEIALHITVESFHL